jgi:hypothetical protein
MSNSEFDSTAARAPDVDRPTYRDYREERRAWRRERREARYRFPFRGMFLGLLLVLLGVLFALEQAGTLTGDAWWQVLLIGLGAILIINGLVRYRFYRWGSYTSLTFGTILVIIGALLVLGFSQWWPIVLIAAGAILLLRFFWR